MIFDKQISRKPNHYPFLDKYIRAMRKNPWDSENFDFDSDLHDYHHVLTDPLRGITNRTLGAIGQIEIAVKTFWAKLGDVLPHPVIQDLGLTMAAVEVVHNDAYERLFEVLGIDHLQTEILEHPVIKSRSDYLTKHTEKIYEDDRKQIVYALALFTLFTENTSLFSQFYVLNWINRAYNCLIDTTQQTNYTVREELIHGMVGTDLINQIRHEHPELFDDEMEARIMSRAQDAYDAECAIVDWILEGYDERAPLGEMLDGPVLKDFVLLRLNDSLQSIQYPELNPTTPELIEGSQWFTEEIIAPVHTDFFHRRPVDYAHNAHSFSPATVLPQLFSNDTDRAN